jgi:hypothetical protein
MRNFKFRSMKKREQALAGEDRRPQKREKARISTSQRRPEATTLVGIYKSKRKNLRKSLVLTPKKTRSSRCLTVGFVVNCAQLSMV